MVEKARFDQLADENFRLKADVAKLEQQLGTKTAVDAILAPYARMVFGYLCAYTALSFAALILSGLRFHGFNLDAFVLKIVVGSTAVSAIGLVGLVIRGIFGALQSK